MLTICERFANEFRVTFYDDTVVRYFSLRYTLLTARDFCSGINLYERPSYGELTLTADVVTAPESRYRMSLYDTHALRSLV